MYFALYLARAGNSINSTKKFNAEVAGKWALVRPLCGRAHSAKAFALNLKVEFGEFPARAE